MDKPNLWESLHQEILLFKSSASGGCEVGRASLQLFEGRVTVFERVWLSWAMGGQVFAVSPGWSAQVAQSHKGCLRAGNSVSCPFSQPSLKQINESKSRPIFNRLLRQALSLLLVFCQHNDWVAFYSLQVGHLGIYVLMKSDWGEQESLI